MSDLELFLQDFAEAVEEEALRPKLTYAATGNRVRPSERKMFMHKWHEKLKDLILSQSERQDSDAAHGDFVMRLLGYR